MTQSILARLGSRVPRPLALRFAVLTRDAGMVRDSLRGRRSPPFTQRLVESLPSSAHLLSPRPMRVAEIVRETRDCVSLVLEDPTGAPVRFLPGQFFTVMATVDGEPLRRAYSASSSALDSARVSITAKRVAGGKMSTWLNEGVTEGDVVSVLGPSGTFVVEPRSEKVRHVVLVGGGSGITPLMAIARAVLAVERGSRVSLTYANRSEADAIFGDALAALAREHSDRFVVRHVVGLFDRVTAAREIDAIYAIDDRTDVATDFYVCGPEAMMAEARAALVARGVEPERIHEERFTSPHLRARAPSPPQGRTHADASHPVTIHARGVEHRVLVAGGRTLLEAALDAGVAMPFSCAMGGCGACKVKLAAGDIEMEEPNCLSAEERAAGYVLACVARPRGPAAVAVQTELA